MGFSMNGQIQILGRMASGMAHLMRLRWPAMSGRDQALGGRSRPEGFSLGAARTRALGGAACRVSRRDRVACVGRDSRWQPKEQQSLSWW